MSGKPNQAFDNFLSSWYVVVTYFMTVLEASVVLISSVSDTQQLSDAHNARGARNLILSRFAPLHDLSLIPSTYSSQISKVLDLSVLER